MSSEAYNRRPGGRRHSKGNLESSLTWKSQEQVVTEMISEEGGKGLRRPRCTVEEVSPFSLISFKSNFRNLGGVGINSICSVVQNTKGINGCTGTVNFPVSLLYLVPI